MVLLKHPPESRNNLTVNSPVLDERQAATYVGFSRIFLKKSRFEGERENRTVGPPWLKIGGRIRYLKTDLDAWLLKHRREPSRGAR